MLVKHCPSENVPHSYNEAAAAAAEEDKIGSSWWTQQATLVRRCCWDHDTRSYHCYWRVTRTYCVAGEWWDEETGMHENSHCAGHHQEGDA